MKYGIFVRIDNSSVDALVHKDDLSDPRAHGCHGCYMLLRLLIHLRKMHQDLDPSSILTEFTQTGVVKLPYAQVVDDLNTFRSESCSFVVLDDERWA